MATGVLRLRLRANVRAYYVNFFTAYTVHSVGNAPALKTHLYTLTHLDHSPPALLCQGKTTHGRSPTSPEGEGTGGAGPEEEGQTKGALVLGVCE